MGNCYLSGYRVDEPVNVCQFSKKRKVYVKFNENFFRKLETDEKIKGLSRDLRDAVTLVCVLDMKITEAAKILHVHRNTITNRIKEAEIILGKY